MRRKISWKDGRTEGQTEGWKDGQTDRGKTVSPPPRSGGIKNYPDRFFVYYFLNSLRFGFDMLLLIYLLMNVEMRCQLEIIQVLSLDYCKKKLTKVLLEAL